MSKVIALMSMSLDGYVADASDGVAEVFDWYFNSGSLGIHAGGADAMTFKVSGPSAGHIRSLTSGLGAGIRAYPPDSRRLATPRFDSPLRDRRHRERRESGQGRGCR